VTYDNPSQVESRAEWTKVARRNWSTFAKFLEKDYEKSSSDRDHE
jgi:hypothetical protein